MTRGASTIPARASSAVSPEPDMGASRLACYRVSLRIDGRRREPIVAAVNEAEAIARAPNIGLGRGVPLPWAETHGRPNTRKDLRLRPPVVVVESARLIHPVGLHWAPRGAWAA